MKLLIEFFDSKKYKNNIPGQLPYIKKKYFLTPTEKKFYFLLCEWFQDKYYIFPQIHIASIIDLPYSQKRQYTYLNKIDRKSIDFVIFDKSNILPILAIELDGYTHNYNNRIERDRFVDEIFKVVSLPILHIKNIDQEVDITKKNIQNLLTNGNKMGTAV